MKTRLIWVILGIILVIILGTWLSRKKNMFHEERATTNLSKMVVELRNLMKNESVMDSCHANSYVRECIEERLFITDDDSSEFFVPEFFTKEKLAEDPGTMDFVVYRILAFEQVILFGYIYGTNVDSRNCRITCSVRKGETFMVHTADLKLIFSTLQRNDLKEYYENRNPQKELIFSWHASKSRTFSLDMAIDSLSLLFQDQFQRFETLKANYVSGDSLNKLVTIMP